MYANTRAPKRRGKRGAATASTRESVRFGFVWGSATRPRGRPSLPSAAFSARAHARWGWGFGGGGRQAPGGGPWPPVGGFSRGGNGALGGGPGGLCGWGGGCHSP